MTKDRPDRDFTLNHLPSRADLIMRAADCRASGLTLAAAECERLARMA